MAVLSQYLATQDYSTATMVYFCLIVALGLVVNAASHLEGSECCDIIVVQGGGGARENQPKIFTTYFMDLGVGAFVNGHRTYTSLDGSTAIAFNKDHKEWKIQPLARR